MMHTETYTPVFQSCSQRTLNVESWEPGALRDATSRDSIVTGTQMSYPICHQPVKQHMSDQVITKAERHHF